MTHQQKLEAIRQACIAVNPEIVELKFGCRVSGLISGAVIKYDKKLDAYMFDNGLWTSKIEIENLKHIKIIGRELQLSDILMAIGEKSPGCQLLTWATGFFQRFTMGKFERMGAQWNLRQPFSNQSPETIDFIYELSK